MTPWQQLIHHVIIPSDRLVWFCKKLMNRNPRSPEWGGHSPCDHSRAQQEDRLLLLPVRTQPSKSYWLFVSIVFTTSHLLYKTGLLPICRPRVAILCWSQTHPSLLEKYLVVYWLHVNNFNQGRFQNTSPLYRSWQCFQSPANEP